jgi:hypothetical protein
MRFAASPKMRLFGIWYLLLVLGCHGGHEWRMWFWSYQSSSWEESLNHYYTEGDCLEDVNHCHLRGWSLGEQDADPLLEQHRPFCRQIY